MRVVVSARMVFFLGQFGMSPHLFLIEPPGDYSVPLGKNPSISTASPRGSVRAEPVVNFYPLQLNMSRMNNCTWN
jgi:hypothetical protein